MPPMTDAAAARAKISAFIVCCNEERNILRCLESVKWCDEIVIVDSGSTDRTLEICRQYTDRILKRAWPGFVEQKRFALNACSHEWCINLDADEEVSPALRDELIAMLTRDSRGSGTMPDGYYLLRVVFYLGRWWRKGGWYPEYRLRVCRRSKTRWGGEDPHEKAEVDGKTTKLENELRHYTYVDIAHQVRTINNFSSISAKTLSRKRVSPSVLKVIINPPLRFFRFYVLRRGYREGFPGFIVGIQEAYNAFLKYVKLWELERLSTGTETSPVAEVEAATRKAAAPEPNQSR